LPECWRLAVPQQHAEQSVDTSTREPFNVIAQSDLQADSPFRVYNPGESCDSTYRAATLG
jgi:hypothetical protein